MSRSSHRTNRILGSAVLLASLSFFGHAQAASCPTSFIVSNAASQPAAITIHSRTRLNMTWTPNLINPSQDASRQVAELAASAVAVAAMSQGYPVPISAARNAAGQTVDAIFQMRDDNLKARTFIVPANARNARIDVALPVTCSLKRSYTFRTFCPGGASFMEPQGGQTGFNEDRSVRVGTICRS